MAMLCRRASLSLFHLGKGKTQTEMAGCYGEATEQESCAQCGGTWEPTADKLSEMHKGIGGEVCERKCMDGKRHVVDMISCFSRI